MNNILILKGNIVFTKNKDAFTVHENSYIISEDGLIIGIYKNIPSQFVGIDIIDYRNSLIIPSFVDLHTHAPQYLQMGNGLDLQLIDWLNQYTYPAEIRISDAGFAESIYHQFVNELYKNGSLRSVIFTTIHEKSTEILFSKIKNVGLSAYIGNVNMDRNAPRELIEDTEESITKTMRIIKKYGDNKLIKPIITPRFAPCCSDKLLKGLGDVVKETNVPVQTHLSENPSEIEWVKELFPDCPNYTSVYMKYGLYGINKTLMAHAVYLTEEEIKLAKNDKIFLVHCPDSNLNLSSGIMPVAMFLDSGIQIGLGTDIGASHTLSMANTIVKAVQSSKANNIYNRDSRILKLSEAFYLATKGGGNFFGNTGSFEAGYTLDALIINEDDQLLKNELTPLARLQRYLYSGDNSSIIARYLEGKKLQYNVSGKRN